MRSCCVLAPLDEVLLDEALLGVLPPTLELIWEATWLTALDAELAPLLEEPPLAWLRGSGIGPPPPPSKPPPPPGSVPPSEVAGFEGPSLQALVFGP